MEIAENLVDWPDFVAWRMGARNVLGTHLVGARRWEVWKRLYGSLLTPVSNWQVSCTLLCRCWQEGGLLHMLLLLNTIVEYCIKPYDSIQ